MQSLPKSFQISDEIIQALSRQDPIVALESTVITHGLPFPDNLILAREMEDVVRLNGGVPATIAVIDGTIVVGVTSNQMTRLAQGKDLYKVSTRDFSVVLSRKGTGGTTVAGTAFVAHKVGIKVFATGGIGGVHRSPAYDISTDLTQLENSPIIVVCAGAKAILDIPATVEYLETLGIPTIGYKTDEFPAFYSLSSGQRITVKADTPEIVASIAKEHWEIGMRSAILVTVPPPADMALPNMVVEEAIQLAIKEAETQRISGQKVTPFLLERVNQLTSGASLRVNLALLKNNALVATQIACELSSQSAASD